MGDLLVDVGRARVTREGVEIPLPRLSFDLLVALVEAAPSILSLDALMDRVWSGVVVSPETVSQRVKLLRDALGDESKEPRYVASVRGRGYRLVPEVTQVVARPEGAPVPVVPADAAPAAEPERSPELDAAAPIRSVRHVWLAAAAFAVVAALAATAAWRHTQREVAYSAGGKPSPSAPAAVAPVRSVAVLAFENRSSAHDDDALAFGIAESLLHQLAGLPGLEVIARTSSFAFAGKSVDAREIGRQLGVRYLVEGSVQRDGPRLRVTAQLIDSLNGSHVWSLRFDRTREDIFSVQDEIAVQVARALQLSLDAPTTDRLVGQGTQSFDAYLAFLQGRALLATARVSDAKVAMAHFATATRLDPGFAAAYVSLAQAELFAAEYETTPDWSQRFAAARHSAGQRLERALQLDPDNGAAYLERAYIEAFTDLEAAEASYRKGLALQPSSARGYAGLAAVVYENPARRAESLQLLDQARRLDPLEPSYDVTKSVYYLYDIGDVRQAETLLRQVLQRQPLYVPALTRLGELLWCCTGRQAEGIQYLEQALALEPLSQWTRRALISAYLNLSDPAAAEAVVDSAAPRLEVLEVPLLIQRRDWLAAGRAAYAAVASGTVLSLDEISVVLAIRRHARVTGQWQRAAGALQQLSGVSWDESGEPRLPERPDIRISTIGLADVLQIGGQVGRSQRLLRSLRERMDRELADSKRSRLWYYHSYPVDAALSGDADLALKWLSDGVAHDALLHRLDIFELDPAFDGLRRDPRFIQAWTASRDNARRERARLDRMRAEGVVPRRGSAT